LLILTIHVGSKMQQLNRLVLDGRPRGCRTGNMNLRLLFWLIMILVLLFGLFSNWHSGVSWGLAMPLLEYVLFFILGWRVFGAPVSNT
jgi:hypothetical protein